MKRSTISSDDFARLVEGIKMFSSLKDNWDNEHALPISESAITRAIGILHVLRRRELLKENKDDFYIGKDCVSMYCLDFKPTPEGGVKISGGFSIALYEFIIPPDSGVGIFINAGYMDENAKPPEYVQTTRAYTKNYEEIADIIDDSILD